MNNTPIVTTLMHTGGQAIRIVDKGQIEIKGDTILDKMQYCEQYLDHIRKLLLFEPRGHYDMFGVYLVDPDIDGMDIGCIFVHNEGYGTMCGDVIISLGRYLVDNNLVMNITSPETKVLIQCPCGPVEAFVETDGDKSGIVRFKSVPSFVYMLDYEVTVPEVGKIMVDIVFGGAFYAIVPDYSLGTDIDKTETNEISKVAFSITKSIQKVLKISHPEQDDLGFLYGTIITDGKDEFSDTETKNVCVYGGRMVDRSPCGSGVTSRITLQYARGEIKQNQTRVFKSPTGATFRAKVVQAVKYCGHDAVEVEVAGQGHYCGKCEFILESDDTIGKGFILR